MFQGESTAGMKSKGVGGGYMVMIQKQTKRSSV